MKLTKLTVLTIVLLPAISLVSCSSAPQAQPAKAAQAEPVPPGKVALEVVNRGGMELQFSYEDGPAGAKSGFADHTLQRGETVKVFVKPGNVSIVAGTFINGKMKPGTSSKVGFIRVAKAEKLTFTQQGGAWSYRQD